MSKIHPFFLAFLAAASLVCLGQLGFASTGVPATKGPVGFIDAAAFGFSPDASGIENSMALQRAVDGGGTILVTRPGTYKVADTVYLGSNTTLKFGNSVFLKKVWEDGPFSSVFMNKGAATRAWNEHIEIDGLQLIVNGVDVRTFKEAYGLHGQLAFFYAKDVRIHGFRCLDLGSSQFGIQVCTFEDLLIEDFKIKGLKDGVHLGRGKRFVIRDGIFQTFDDAIALNAHDYSVGNPELGWIEDGIIENCSDLDAEKTTGFFCRILAGGWTDWKEGMEVQESDTVAAKGRLYRVQAKSDGKVYKSLAMPSHTQGIVISDGIPWGLVQTDVTHSAGVRNVVFRDIFLHKNRTGFSVHFDNDQYSRSYYPGGEIPVQQNLLFENIKDLRNGRDGRCSPLFNIATPLDSLVIGNSYVQDNCITFVGNKAMQDYGRTSISMIGCTFSHPGVMNLLVNAVPGKVIKFKTCASAVLNGSFSATIVPGQGHITIDSDLPGLDKESILKEGLRD
jgi:hypothetical protein